MGKSAGRHTACDEGKSVANAARDRRVDLAECLLLNVWLEPERVTV
jgi:hypothetical protein